MLEHLLEEKYTFLRKLKTPADLMRVYNEIDERLGRVKPHKSIQTYSCPPLTYNDTDDDKIEIKVEVFSRENKTWIKRIRFPEQLLACDRVWLVHHTYQQTYMGAVPAAVRTNIEIEEIELPALHCKGSTSVSPHVVPKDIEVYRQTESVPAMIALQSENTRDVRSYSVQQINIVPTTLVEFDAVFYDKTVANLYAESLERHMTMIHTRRRY